MSRVSGRWVALFSLATCLVVAIIVTLIALLVWQLTTDHCDVTDSAQRGPVKAVFRHLLELGDQRKLTIRNRDGQVTNEASLAVNSTLPAHATECYSVSEEDICYEWKGDRKLSITSQQGVSQSGVRCYDVTWTALACVTQVHQDCYSLERAHWYGGFQDYHQYWPLNGVQQAMAPYITGDTWAKQYGDVQERLFVSSNGFGVYVYPEVPLYLSFNDGRDGRLCVATRYHRHPYRNPAHSLPVLRYQLCQGPDVKALHRHMTSLHVPKPRDIPAEDLFRGAIWSTWVRFKGQVNQSKVLLFAQEIADSGLPFSQLEIDDNWTPRYGDMDFHPDKFPQPRQMVSRLTRLGFRVTVWLHPFLNLDSRAAIIAQREGYLVRALDSPVPALVRWWRGDAAFLLDVTNPRAVSWFLNATAALTASYNVTSFKFDAGESNWLPPVYSTHRPLDSPNDFSRLFVDMAYRADTAVRAQEVRVGARSQHVPIMVRVLDRQSAWGQDRAIRTVIPAVLTLGLIGYPFVLPDMIGGNGADESNPDYLENSVLPSPELYVRWLQMNTFLPLLQFSVGPWVYNSTIQAICRKFMDIRRKYTDTIVSLAREATRTGAPLVRPVWWIAPNDSSALTVDSQFLLGDDLLVAPVLEKGSRSREVYLPAGTWRDETVGGSHVGPMWLKGYKAELDELPHFHRLGP